MSKNLIEGIMVKLKVKVEQGWNGHKSLTKLRHDTKACAFLPLLNERQNSTQHAYI